MPDILSDATLFFHAFLLSLHALCRGESPLGVVHKLFRILVAALAETLMGPLKSGTGTLAVTTSSPSPSPSASPSSSSANGKCNTLLLVTSTAAAIASVNSEHMNTSSSSLSSSTFPPPSARSQDFDRPTISAKVGLLAAINWRREPLLLRPRVTVLVFKSVDSLFLSSPLSDSYTKASMGSALNKASSDDVLRPGAPDLREEASSSSSKIFRSKPGPSPTSSPSVRVMTNADASPP